MEYAWLQARHLGHNDPRKINTARISTSRITVGSVSDCQKTLTNATTAAMFSPDAAVAASIDARNPRRRQRTGSEDSVTLRHNPKRIRRSRLSAETFQPLEATKQNGHVQHLAEEPITNGHVKEPSSQRHASLDSTSLSIRHRGVKKADRERRANKHDGSIELVSSYLFRITVVIALTICELRQKTKITLLLNCRQLQRYYQATKLRVRYQLARGYHFLTRSQDNGVGNCLPSLAVRLPRLRAKS